MNYDTDFSLNENERKNVNVLASGRIQVFDARVIFF